MATFIQGDGEPLTQPSPNYPQEIQSVGDRTKNLLPINDNVSVTYQGVTITIENDVITLNGTTTTNFQFGVYRENGKLKVLNGVVNIENKVPSLINKLESGTYTQSLKYISGTITSVNNVSKYVGIYTYKDGVKSVDTRKTFSMKDDKYTFSFDGDKEVQFFVIQIGAINGELTFDNFKFKFQLEKGDTATDYEPYGYKMPVKVNNKTINIYLNEPLRKIGNYFDYIDYKNKKVVRNITKYTFDNTESIAISRTGDINQSYYMYTPALKDINIKTGEYLYSDILSYQQNTQNIDTTKDVYLIGYGGNTSLIYFQLSLKLATTSDEVKTLLNGKKIYGVALIPTEETIDIPKISTFKGTNIFSIDTKLEPSGIRINYWKQIGVAEVTEEIVQSGTNLLIVSTGAEITQSGNNLVIGG